jgi:hypothetical protein
MLYSTRYFDWVFGIGAILCLAALTLSAVKEFPLPSPPEQPILYGVVLCATVIAVSLLSCLTSRLDHRYADDYLFQLLAQSAMIAVVAIILVSIAKDLVLLPLFGGTQAPLMIITVIPVVGLSWALGYFYLRLRGTGA